MLLAVGMRKVIILILFSVCLFNAYGVISENFEQIYKFIKEYIYINFSVGVVCSRLSRIKNNAFSKNSMHIKAGEKVKPKI